MTQTAEGQSAKERRRFRPKIAKDAIELTGNTPLVRLNKITEGAVANVIAKLESYNPGFFGKMPYRGWYDRGCREAGRLE